MVFYPIGGNLNKDLVCMGLPLPEKFRAAIEKGVRNIKGKLCPLNADEKRQLLADLREHEDCPEGWKNMTPKKEQGILRCLHQAIEKLLNPEESTKKKKAANDRTNKRNRENGKKKEYDARWSAKRAKAIREANKQAILENKDHHEPSWDEDTLEKKATEIVEMIVEKCGRNGFVHVCGGAWPGKDVNEAAEAECFGKGRNRHAVFIDDTGRKFVRYRDVSTHVMVMNTATTIDENGMLAFAKAFRFHCFFQFFAGPRTYKDMNESIRTTFLDNLFKIFGC